MTKPKAKKSHKDGPLSAHDAHSMAAFHDGMISMLSGEPVQQYTEYYWQEYFIDPLTGEQQPLTLEDANKLVKQVMALFKMTKDIPVVFADKDKHGETIGGAVTAFDKENGTITITANPKMGGNIPNVILHEACHAVLFTLLGGPFMVKGQSVEGHNPTFVRTYIEVLIRIMHLDRAKVMETLEKSGIKSDTDLLPGLAKALAA